MIRFAVLAAIAVAFASSVQAKTEIPPGKWSFVFTDAKGRADRPMRVYTYRPRECDTKCPIQFVLHGLKRNDLSSDDLAQTFPRVDAVIRIALSTP